MCSTVQEQITMCGQNAIVKIGERTNIRPQKIGYLQLTVNSHFNDFGYLQLTVNSHFNDFWLRWKCGSVYK